MRQMCSLAWIWGLEVSIMRVSRVCILQVSTVNLGLSPSNASVDGVRHLLTSG